MGPSGGPVPPTGHGMGSLSADMCAADLAAMKAALTAMAKGMVARDQADHHEHPDTPVRTMD